MNLELTASVLLAKLYSLLPNSVSDKKTSIKTIVVAYSGGLDSHVLLHLLSRIPEDELNIRAIYINHGLQQQATEWAEHCQKTCQELNISFNSIDLNLTVAKGESTEEVARNARYQALFDSILADEILVTAHHQQDQAETLLLQLFRGAGVQGLAAMADVNEFKANGNTHLHLRPLLTYSRNELETYAKEYALEHIEDPSNKNTAFDRNFLRQDIMPLLRGRWLGIDKTISRSATIQAETKTLLDEFAQQQLPSILAADYCIETNQARLAPIDISELCKLSLSKQRLLLRYWISQQGFENPSEKKIGHIFSDLINAADDKQPLIVWRGVELRRYQQHLYIMSPLEDHDASQIISWRLDSPLEIKSLLITIDPSVMDGMNSSEKVTVRFRQGGEKIDIPNRGNISLKNLFQEYQIPAWIRSRLPLIYVDEKLIKIIGLDDLKRHPPTY